MAALSRDNLSGSDMRLVGEGEISRTNDGQISLRAPLNDPKALYQRAYDDLRQGNYDMAEKDFSSLIEKFPKHDLGLAMPNTGLARPIMCGRNISAPPKPFSAGSPNMPMAQKPLTAC